jgi:hypothetical protein
MNGTRRALLTSIAALGGVITLASTSGVFAVFSDHATTGTNTFATKGLPRAADLQLATGAITVDDTSGIWTVDCGTYTDNLSTGLVTLTDAVSLDGYSTDYVCVKNTGSQTVDVTTSAIDITDEDTDCTGDESVVDTTCGVQVGQPVGTPPQAGELSPLLHVTLFIAPCDDANQGGSGIGTLPGVTDAPVATLAPGHTTCVRYSVGYVATEAEAQVAQSDTTTWRFAFDGTVPTT